MANIVNARDKNNNIVYPITKTSLVLDNNGTSVDILLAGKQNSLTSAQMTAANSGITSALVAQITTNATNIGTLQTDVSSLQTTVSNKMDKDNPTGTGSFSLNRLAASTTGSYSSTLGRYNTASGSYSHSAGYYTTAQRRSQQTFGEYNILDTTGSSTSSKGSFIEIVGNGTSTTNRSNARTLDWSGNEVLAGNLRAAGLTDGTTTKTMTEILAGGGSTITVDSALSTTSENPVQNKVITNALSDKMNNTDPVGTGMFSMNRLANSAIGANSSTLGVYNTASGSAAHAEGNGNSSTGQQSHAEGYTNTASGNNSHAEGGNNTASGGSSHVEGSANTASGTTSHAEGFTTMAIGNYSHSEGYGTRANRQSQHVFGEFNIIDNSGSSGAERGDYVEIVGNGTADNARSNARILDWSGNETLAGTSTATGFKTPNGTSSQLLMADGNTIDYQSSQNDSANKIVQRDSNSDVLVPTTPSSNNGAASKSYVDGFVVPTAYYSATMSNTARGFCKYVKIGKLVWVRLGGIVIASGTPDHNATIVSGLPTVAENFIILLPSFTNAQGTALRLRLETDGTIQTHYTQNASFGDTSNEHDMVFCYITNE